MRRVPRTLSRGPRGVLAAQDDPRGKRKGTWARLEPQRQRCANWYRNQDFYADYPSRFLVRVGLAWTDHLRRQAKEAPDDTSPGDGLSMLFEACRGVYVRSGGLMADSWRGVVGACCARLPGACPGVMGRWLLAVGHDTEAAVSIAWHVLKNGGAPTVLRKGFHEAGLDLGDVVATIRSWWEAISDETKDHRLLPEVLELLDSQEAK